MGAYDIVTDILDEQAGRRPEHRAIVFLRNGEEEDVSLSYAELRSRALAAAVHIGAHIQPGSRAVLIYPPGPEFIIALFGALYAGVIAVPLAPPRRGGDRLDAVLSDCGARALMGPAAVLRRAQGMISLGMDVVALADEQISAGGPGASRGRACAASEVALLQYTSGSTGAPKGVMLSHANILSNQDYISRCYRHHEGFTCVSWLPMYHDMGLMAGILQPLFMGGTAVLMSPFSFLQKPVRWLKAISDHRAYSSGAPNFAYDLCVDRIPPDQTGFDLSAWEIACVGAEPVRAVTMDRFANRFARQGFRRAALCPSYGLAEATLLVTGCDQTRAPTIANLARTADKAQPDGRLVSSGLLTPDADVMIVDPLTGSTCAEGKEGEICIRGPGVSEGYWGRGPRPARRLTRNGVARDYLPTRDLGFLLEGELFITGRADDLIIIQGRNHHANDLEMEAVDLDVALDPHSCAAFAVQAGPETLVVMVLEVLPRSDWEGRPWPRIFSDLRERLAERHDLSLGGVLVLREGQVPTTTSGKIRRSRCREMFEADDFAAVAQWRGQSLRRGFPHPVPASVEDVDAGLARPEGVPSPAE